VIHSFEYPPKGDNPQGSLITDSAGNLYGVTLGGGRYNAGVVFELSPTINGWKEQVLYAFRGGADGQSPAPGLVMDAAGNLYGVTTAGGNASCLSVGCGTVFELKRTSSGWTESVIYSFKDGSDGGTPAGSLVLDSAGNLYGTTVLGGLFAHGQVFKLARALKTWAKSTLYSFRSGADGAQPLAGVIFDNAGNLFGTTSKGGNCNVGTVFELARATHGWVESVLYSFPDNPSADYPAAGLAFDGTGNLYGTTMFGTVFQLTLSSGKWVESTVYSLSAQNGVNGGVVVDEAGDLYVMTQRNGLFELSLDSSGAWNATLLYGTNGSRGNLVSDAAGNIYGTSGSSGLSQLGVVFKLARSSSSNTGWIGSDVYSFPASCGATPIAGLVVDASGNLYGATVSGGTYNLGTIFELSPNGSGGWIEKVLHNFRGGVDGEGPRSKLTLDAVGNLYGSASGGGPNSGGYVFELSPLSGGGWSKKTLYSFCAKHGCPDGYVPGDVVFGADGNIYGTTAAGGTWNAGTLFKLSNSSSGWTETVLYSGFHGTTGVGAVPNGGLVFDSSGNIYGTTVVGFNGKGTVFELSLATSALTYIYAFSGPDGATPRAGLTIDADGNLFGTTSVGGAHQAGTVFELKRNGTGWNESVLYSFAGGTDADSPYAGVILDGAGNLLGTTLGGGTIGYGAVFELTPTSGGWTETVLHSFAAGLDGSSPLAGVTLGPFGDLYGTTYASTSANTGTVFEISY